MRFLLLILLPSLAAAAEFAPVFTDHAVLQRDRPVAVWGTGRNGEKIEVEILGHELATEVRDGKWTVTLPAMPATDSTTLTLRGDDTVELKDVAVGEVWLGLGQSNMEWQLDQCGEFTAGMLAAADNPRVRELKFPRRTNADGPPSGFAWTTFDRASAPRFGAVAYFFAAALQRRLGVTVGIVNCSHGGTMIEAWMSREALAAAGKADLVADYDRKVAEWPDTATYEKALANYNKARKAWDERKKTNPGDPQLGPAPVEPDGPRNKRRPAGLHEAMLSFITPYTARGALWYQGESNAGQPGDYAKLLPVFVDSLRTAWQQPDLPFFLVQIAKPSTNLPDDGDAYPKFRDMQRAAALALPHSGFVVALDRGKRGDVHPPDKQPVGERLARLALARVYGEKGFAAQSPSAESARLTHGRVEITFRDLPGKLQLRDPTVPTLEMRDESGAWKPATAVAVSDDGKRLLASPPPGSGYPSEIRYAWRNFCTLSLFTDEGLPVAPWSLTVALGQ